MLLSKVDLDLETTLKTSQGMEAATKKSKELQGGARGHHSNSVRVLPVQAAHVVVVVVIMKGGAVSSKMPNVTNVAK